MSGPLTILFVVFGGLLVAGAIDRMGAAVDLLVQRWEARRDPDDWAVPALQARLGDAPGSRRPS